MQHTASQIRFWGSSAESRLPLLRSGTENMELELNALDWVSNQIRQHLGKIGFAFFATLLAIFGQDINRVIRKKIYDHHFIVRTIIFIFWCAFGYGWLVLFIAPQFAELLRYAPPRALPAIVLVLFTLLGILAERKRKI